MDIWIIRNGEKYGPFHDYDIRRRITEGELHADAPAWHEGLPEWTTLSRIHLFENEFTLARKPAPVSEDIATAVKSTPPPIPGKPRIIRRFWARCFDLQLYIAVWWLLLWATGRNVEAIFFNPWIAVSQLVPWCVIEIFLIHRFGTTPGKWLLGLQVLNADGSRLDLGESTRRALRVYVLGIGLGLPYISLFCMAMSVFTIRRAGNSIWDHLGKHRVPAAPLAWQRTVLFAFLVFVAIQAQVAVIAPYQVKLLAADIPWFKEQFEKNPPWHLPQRHK